MATIFDMELNEADIDNGALINNNNNACSSGERQIIDYDEFDEDEPIVVDNEIEVVTGERHMNGLFLILFSKYRLTILNRAPKNWLAQVQQTIASS